MKTFEEIFDGLFKLDTGIEKVISDFHEECRILSRVEDVVTERTRNRIINNKYSYAKALMEPFYGRDINEPIVKVCRRILEKPDRFVCVKYVEEKWTGYRFSGEYMAVLQDKDTQQKFVFTEYNVKFPTFLTQDECILLKEVSKEWYIHTQGKIRDKEQKELQKRNDKFRQEMINLYKDID